MHADEQCRLSDGCPERVGGGRTREEVRQRKNGRRLALDFPSRHDSRSKWPARHAFCSKGCSQESESLACSSSHPPSFLSLPSIFPLPPQANRDRLPSTTALTKSLLVASAILALPDAFLAQTPPVPVAGLSAYICCRSLLSDCPAPSASRSYRPCAWHSPSPATPDSSTHNQALPWPIAVLTRTCSVLLELEPAGVCSRSRRSIACCILLLLNRNFQHGASRPSSISSSRISSIASICPRWDSRTLKSGCCSWSIMLNTCTRIHSMCFFSLPFNSLSDASTEVVYLARPVISVRHLIFIC